MGIWMTRRRKPGRYAEPGSRTVRGGAVVALLAGLLAAYQVAIVLTDLSLTDGNVGGFDVIAGPRGADGGSPQFLEPPGSVPDSAADRTRSVDRHAVQDHQVRTVGLPTAHGIPSTVLRAYHNAAEQLGAERPGCGVSVPLLAAIGRVESSHLAVSRVGPGATHGASGPTASGVEI